MSSTHYRQELPPPKGYEKIIYEKIPLKGPMVTWKKVGILLGVMAYGAVQYRIAKQIVQDNEFETAAARVAMMPLLNAERDRAVLKHLKQLREQEAELMKNVPGWETGTLYGEPIYKTIKPDEYYSLTVEDIFAHAGPYELESILLHTRFE